MPIDINLLRVEAGIPYSWKYNFIYIGGEPEKIKKSERERFRDDKVIDEIIEIDVKWRKCKIYSFSAIYNEVTLTYSKIWSWQLKKRVRNHI